jgi:hypothetical protein
VANWPADWINRTLVAAKVEPSGQAVSILRAWKNSTPLPPLSNNPLGFPAGTTGAPSYLGTHYAIFPSMEAFYSAVAKFATSAPGRAVVAALGRERGYAAAWRAISDLPWPARETETDWPAAVLDLTAESYRQSVSAAMPAERKTSGVVGADVPGAASVLDLMRALHSTVANANDAVEATRIMIAKGARYG